MKTGKAKTVLLDLLLMLVGSAVYAVEVNAFTAPNNIAAGGVTGIATMLNYLFCTPIGLISFFINAPLVVWAVVEIGYKLVAKTMVAIVLTSVMIDLFSHFVPAYQGDPLLVALFAGACEGVGLSLIFIRGATTGGTDLIARLVKLKLPWISMGNMLLVIDTAVVVLVALAFGNLTTALYGFIAQVVCAYVTDMVLYGLDTCKTAYIISDNWRAIADVLLTEQDRGVTILRGQGAYSGADKQVLMVAFRQRDIVQLRRTVHSLDPQAFMIVCNAHEVLGEGFGDYQKED